MQTVWTAIRWFLTATLLLDGLLFLWTTIRFTIDLKRHPASYVSEYGRLSNHQVLALFGAAGLLCLALMFLVIPL